MCIFSTGHGIWNGSFSEHPPYNVPDVNGYYLSSALAGFYMFLTMIILLQVKGRKTLCNGFEIQKVHIMANKKKSSNRCLILWLFFFLSFYKFTTLFSRNAHRMLYSRSWQHTACRPKPVCRAAGYGQQSHRLCPCPCPCLCPCLCPCWGQTAELSWGQRAGSCARTASVFP